MPKQDPAGEWHETIRPEDSSAGASDKSFGLQFAALCAAVGIVALWRGRASAIMWCGAALLILLVAIYAHPLLTPLNRSWRRFSLVLFRVVNPAVMGFLYFAVITPFAWTARKMGKDPLRLALDPKAQSYWIPRPTAPDRQTSMSRQF